MSPSSSQSIGVETCAPGRARTDQAPNTVLCGGAFWLKSMKTRRPRSSFHQAAAIRSPTSPFELIVIDAGHSPTIHGVDPTTGLNVSGYENEPEMRDVFAVAELV
jgi:hypothetical protein